MNVYQNLDLNLNFLNEVRFENLASDPTGYSGRVIFNTTSNKLKYYDGTNWIALESVSLGSDITGSSVTISSSGTFTAVTDISLSNNVLQATNTTFTLPDNLVSISALTGTGLLQRNANNTWSFIDSAQVGAGTVTSVAAGTGLATASGNAITTTGTIKLKDSAVKSDNVAYNIQLRSSNNSDLFSGGLTYNPSTKALSQVSLADGSTAVTQSANDSSTKVATTSFVSTAVANAVSAIEADIEALPEPMVFQGSVGTGGTITTLPAASSSNTGYTYKVISDISSPVSAKTGDTVISNGTAWTVIPSGDEPAGTVTSVGLTPTNSATGLTLSVSNSPITSSGNIGLTLSLDSGYTIPTSELLTSYFTTLNTLTTIVESSQATHEFTIVANTYSYTYDMSETILSDNVICQLYEVSNTTPAVYTQVLADISISNQVVTVTFGNLPAVGTKFSLRIVRSDIPQSLIPSE